MNNNVPMDYHGALGDIPGNRVHALAAFVAQHELSCFKCGGAYGMKMTGKEIDLYAFVGLIMLFGVVKKNAILQIDHMNQLRRKGMNRADAMAAAYALNIMEMVLLLEVKVGTFQALLLTNF